MSTEDLLKSECLRLMKAQVFILENLSSIGNIHTKMIDALSTSREAMIKIVSLIGETEHDTENADSKSG